MRTTDRAASLSKSVGRIGIAIATTAAIGIFAWAGVAQTALRPMDEIAHLNTDLGAQGQAFLFHRGETCFAVTPRHVLKDNERDERYARLTVARTGRAPLRAQGDRCGYASDLDLALMRVSGVDPSTDCGSIFVGQGGIDQVLASTTEGSLSTATESGSIERRTLRLATTRANDGNHFWVSPRGSADVPASGMSGGIVSFRDRSIGFLLSDDLANSRYHDNWRVLRIDAALVKIGQMFEGRGGGVIDNVQCFSPASARSAALAAKASNSQNFASASCGATVLGFSSPPQSSAERPEAAIDDDANTFWRAAGSLSASIDVRLCGARARPVSAVVLSASPSCAKSNVGEVEVFVRGHPRGPWTSLGGSAPEANGSITVRSPSPLNTYEIRAVVRPRAGQATLNACFSTISAN